MKKFLLFLVFVLGFLFYQDAFAFRDAPRGQNFDFDRNNLTWKCDVDKLNFLPYWGWGDESFDFDAGKFQGDLSIEVSNPFCLGYIGLFYAALNWGSGTSKLIATTTLVGLASVPFGIASVDFNETRICGHDWVVWGHSDIDTVADPVENYPVKGPFHGSYKKRIADCIIDKKCDEEFGDILEKLKTEGRSFNITDKIYREYKYQGEEFAYSECIDPRMERLSYDVPGTTQLYYMKGLDAANFACDRFLMDESVDKDVLEEAYDCCVKASDSLLCLESSFWGESKFCSADVFGSLCWFKGAAYSIYEGKGPNKICAKTWSLCPYNHNIGGGTETKLFYDDDVCSSEDEYKSCFGKVKNFCQLDRHCTFLSVWKDLEREPKKVSPYFDKACINFVGSSHNNDNYIGYRGYYVLGKNRDFKTSFSAPIAECINESMKNFLFNRAGHTKCKVGSEKLESDDSEMPDSNEVCKWGYEFRRNQDLGELPANSEYSNSHFIKLQKLFRNFTKIIVMLSISLFGAKVIMTGGALNRKVIFSTLIKIILVLSFAYSTRWYEMMFNLTYSASNTLASIATKIDFDDTVYGIDAEGAPLTTLTKEDLAKFDGCFFGYSELLSDVDNNYSDYGDKTYLAMFDSLDCKIAKYLSYGTKDEFPAILYVVALVFSVVGIFIIIFTLFLIFLLVSFTIKALYIFIMSTMSITVMLYVSPLIIPMVLFDKTKGIFNKWLQNLIGYVLQPMMLFAFLSMSLSLIDKYAYGDALFDGNSPKREVICSSYCKSQETDMITVRNAAESDCESRGDDFIDPTRNSFICILEGIQNNAWWKHIPILSTVFISISLADIDAFVFLQLVFLIFILNKVINKIPGMISTLAGGGALKGMEKIYGVGDTAEQTFKKSWWVVSKVDELAFGSLKKYGGGALEIAKKAKEEIDRKGGKDSKKDKKPPDSTMTGVD